MFQMDRLFLDSGKVDSIIVADNDLMYSRVAWEI
jgi:hypothetical protein